MKIQICKICVEGSVPRESFKDHQHLKKEAANEKRQNRGM